MTFLMRLIPVWMAELVARLAAYCIAIVKPAWAFAIERQVRGKYWGLRLGGKGLNIGRNVQFEGNRFNFGRNVKLYCGGHYITGPQGSVTIGSRTHIARFSIVSGMGGIEIGEDCAISSYVAIYSVTSDTSAETLGSVPTKKSAVSIGNNVYIGVGAKILPGVAIGDNAVIGAGAVVSKDVPADAIAVGIPAKSRPKK